MSKLQVHHLLTIDKKNGYEIYEISQMIAFFLDNRRKYIKRTLYIYNFIKNGT